MYDDLVKRLRSRPFAYDHDGMELADQGVEFEAADAIVALQARVAELERLLTHTGLLAAQDEHNALRHDIARHVQIAAEQAQEAEELKADLAAARALLLEALHKMRMVENHVCPPDEWDEVVEGIDSALAGQRREGEG